jgi:hypothetical protein
MFYRSRITLAFAVAPFLVAGCASVETPSPNRDAVAVSCAMTSTASGYAGKCQVPCIVNALAVNFEGVDKARSCASAPRAVDATLAKTAVAKRWLGTMQGVQPEDPTRFEVVPNKSGTGAVARTPFGWFVVSAWSETSQALSFNLDASRQVRPNSDDLAILARATQLIPSVDKWNKNDTRQCPAGATPVLRVDAGNNRNFRRCSLPTARDASGARGA